MARVDQATAARRLDALLRVGTVGGGVGRGAAEAVREPAGRPERGQVSLMAFSSDGVLLAGAGDRRGEGEERRSTESQVTIWDVQTGERLRTLEGPAGTVTAIASSAAGHAVACSSRRVLAWDAASGEALWTWNEGHRIVTLGFSPDGKSLAVCDSDEFILIDAATGNTTRVLMKTTLKAP